MNRLYHYRLLFVLSTVSVTASFLVVLILTYYLVVPYRLATELILSACTVVALTPERTLTQPCGEHMIINSTVVRLESDSSLQSNLWLCLQVHVAYNFKKVDNLETYEIGILSNVAASGSLNDEILFATNTEYMELEQKDCCSGCLAVSQPKTSMYRNCTMVLSHGRSSINLHLQEELFCYYQRSMPDVLVRDHKVMVNIILWPTLVFIAGFVTMFISYIKMQQETESMKNRRRKAMKMNILNENSHISL